ncbi:right-handed parallel beta-helix repeat-containing protein [Nocardioides sp. W7]|uniref:right-handed parallel beta-helix repeat-containing protein n=1 Tax=Nocardioides sp. W7 TaxID=2931390 RepID=UPI001FD3021C|nr:right-handed parallel beta-helix repeat-containing protein [Nocardioides sp. W7]
MNHRLRAALLAPTALLVGCSSGSGAPPATPAATVAAAPEGGGSFAEAFSSASSAERFATSGPGEWVVADGVYQLRSGGGSVDGAPPADPPLSVAREQVDGATWRLEVEATPGSERAEWSVVFARTTARDYSYVHLDAQAGASGIYVVTGGRAVQVAPLEATATGGTTQSLELRRSGKRLKVYVGSGGDPSYVGGASLPAASAVQPGLGSWGGSVAFDNLVVTAEGATVPVTPDPPPSDVTPSGPPTSPTPVVIDGPGRAVGVGSSEELTAALADARPGDVITLADGVYTTKGLQAPLSVGGKRYVGTFVASTSGTETRPVVLRGSRDAVIDGKPGRDGTGTQYGLYLAGVRHWRVEGLTVANVAKGIVLDQTSHTVIRGVAVHDIGQEGIHLRAFSSDNLVQDNEVSRTGRGNDTYGEGIYVGSATSNWGTYSGGRPDASDRNQVLGNRVWETTAESLDIKEGTTGGVIRGNVLDGAHMTGSWADSWIDLKGNGWLVEGNRGTRALQDGFQVHEAVEGWGLDNVFRANTAVVDAEGYGFWIQQGLTGNVVSCDNVVEGARSGFATVGCAG